ncbi:hypothetical protein M514_27233 [Trichuris suis]|uniref:Uncharacterized protein n=1 Tax=Trichuris suis TaxID=68888 RepID=A0A085MTQ4_9BILA|nr:hypothetical protein M514_27233 [Trichuris suis]
MIACPAVENYNPVDKVEFHVESLDEEEELTVNSKAQRPKVMCQR